MRDQLLRLVEASQRPNVTLQILPFDKGAHAGLGGPFTLLEFPDLTDLDLVYVDAGAGNLYLEKILDIRRYAERFDLLRADALPPDASVALISAVMRKLE